MVVSKEISKQILENALGNNKISHAYLFEIDSSLDTNELIFSFIKKVICPLGNNKNCNSCNICKRIDDGVYADLKIIKPDGLWIKKEQLLNLQSEFTKKSIESKNMVYLIKDAEKMNGSAANTMLKFLEEPEEGIVAILTTSNINDVLTTIVSRCQIISLKSSNNLDIPYKDEDIIKAINFLEKLEKEKTNIIADIDNPIYSILKQKNEVIKMFDIILLIYTDILNYILLNKLEALNKYKENLDEIIKFNNKDNIYKKINIIIDIKDKLKYNTNTNLLMDKFVIEFSGVDK